MRSIRDIDWSRVSELALIEAAKAGNPAAFDVLVVRYRRAAVSMAAQIVGRRDLAEDVAQEALISAYKALPQLSDSEKFAAWLGAIVRHRAKRSSLAKDDRSLPLDEVILAHVPSMQDHSQVRGEIACAIAALPLDLRPIAERFYLDDWTARRIADFLGLPLTTVKWRLHSARLSLRDRLAETLEINR